MEYVRKGGKQVMKKKIAVVLTALMVMAMGTTAFAATSPTTKTSETTTADHKTWRATFQFLRLS